MYIYIYMMIGKERAVRFEGKGFVWQTWHINRNPMTHKTKVVQASEMDIWFTMVYPLPVYHSTVNESANYEGVGKNTKHHNYIGNSQRPVIHNWGYDLMEFSQTTIYHMKPSSEQPTGASYWNKSNTHCPSYFAKFKRPSTSMRSGCCIAKLRNCHPSPPVSHGVQSVKFTMCSSRLWRGNAGLCSWECAWIGGYLFGRGFELLEIADREASKYLQLFGVWEQRKIARGVWLERVV